MTTVRPSDAAPLAGIRVVEVAFGVSIVGAGLASSLPGALLRDLGADVTRVRSGTPSTLDAGCESSRAWDHGKQLVDVDGGRAVRTVTALAREADIVFLAGPETLLEQRGLGSAELAALNPRLVTVRIRPSANALGGLPDLELLLTARVGLLTQIRGHRQGPKFNDFAVANVGAGLSATVGALAGLYERESTGRGGWAETSLVDGVQAILPMIIGRVEHASSTTKFLWEGQGPAETLAYPCGDGEYIQLWFGAKGAYEAFLERIGDEPSEQGYNADMMSGAMVERAKRWAELLAGHDRDHWMKEFTGAAFRCEPVLRPGQALLDPHVRETGLSLEHDDVERGQITVLGPVGRVTPVASDGASPPAPGGRLLSGVRVLDLSAYLAGPVTPLILAELGADVIKVEPVTGDVHRTMEPMFAAGQRGKRSVALDLKSPDAAEVLARLFAWGDVVHQNSRMGLAERLGYDEKTVRAANPDVVYCHASGFGPTGPRALLAANDHLMQAISGVEAAQGGAGRPPTFLVWGAIDVTSGWVAACNVLAALYARRRSGAGQSVTTSLLGAALLIKSGAFVTADGTVVEGPVLDAEQTGYGAAYRIYRGADDAWLALAVPDAATWTRLRDTVGVADLPTAPPPLRTERGVVQPAETLLAAAFRTDTAAAWVARLRAADVPAEPVAEPDRAGFVSRVIDDTISRQLGRVASFPWGERGLLEQPGFPLRLGPAPRPAAPARIPGLGEHTHEVLEALGLDADRRAALLAAGAIAAVPEN